MQISDEDAENFKVAGLTNGDKGSDLEALLRPAAQSLAEDIQRTLSLYGAIASEEGIHLPNGWRCQGRWLDLRYAGKARGAGTARGTVS